MKIPWKAKAHAREKNQTYPGYPYRSKPADETHPALDTQETRLARVTFWLKFHLGSKEKLIASTTSPQKLSQLANHEYLYVRMGVARNPNTPADALSQLASENDSEIQSAIAENSNAPSEVIAAIIASRDIRKYPPGHWEEQGPSGATGFYGDYNDFGERVWIEDQSEPAFRASDLEMLAKIINRHDPQKRSEIMDGLRLRNCEFCDVLVPLIKA